MATQAYNLLWLSPDFATFAKIEYFEIPGLSSSEFHKPIPPKTVENIQNIAKQNPEVDVRLWIDSKRLTQEQRDWLENMVSQSELKNLVIHDLRTISEYCSTPLFNKSDDSPYWRADKKSLIWRVVDTARILASLQGDYDQSFYSDADITNLRVNSDEVQQALSNHGCIVSGWADEKSRGMENQLFGFNKVNKDLFRSLYEQTLHDVEYTFENGYPTFISFIRHEILEKRGVDMKEIVFRIGHDGTCAMHPGKPYNFSIPTTFPALDWGASTPSINSLSPQDSLFGSSLVPNDNLGELLKQFMEQLPVKKIINFEP
jgi:hypothetical protein